MTPTAQNSIVLSLAIGLGQGIVEAAEHTLSSGHTIGHPAAILVAIPAIMLFGKWTPRNRE